MSKLIRWFAENHVAANLLMVAILVLGAFSVTGLKRNLFPVIEPGLFEITIPYRGGGPEEIEERILIPVEEAISDIRGIDRIISRAREGVGTFEIWTEIDLDASERQRVANEIKMRVDTINTFPPEADNPKVHQAAFRNRIISLAITGDVDEHTFLKLAQEIEQEVSRLSGVNVTQVSGTREPELAIEVSEFALRKYGLTFDDVATAVRKSSVSLSGGSVKAAGGDIELKTRGQAYTGANFEDIVLLRGEDGTRVLVKDVARVVDGFQEVDLISRFNGGPAVFVDIMEDEGTDIIDISKRVRAYVDQKNKELPEGVTVEAWMDRSTAFGERMSTMAVNAGSGLVLVFVVLFLFLRPKIAVWVTVGIAVSFMGTLWLLPFTSISLNMISSFAFLLILGIVVDDAIIVGESVHLAHEQGLRGREAAISAAQRVSKPVIFAAATTIIAFVPMYFMPGESAKMTGSIPIIIGLTLMFSLIECLLLLPHHLSGMKPLEEPRNNISIIVRNFQQFFANGLKHIAHTWYRPVMETCITWRKTTTVAFILFLAIAQTLMQNNWVRSEFQPNFNMDNIIVDIQVPEGLAFEQTEAILRQVEDATFTLQGELDAEHPKLAGTILNDVLSRAQGNRIFAVLAFENLDRAGLDISVLSERWRALVGDLPDVLEFHTQFANNGGYQDVLILLSAADPKVLDAGVAAVKAQLETYAGAYDIGDLKRGGTPEMVLKLRENAESMTVGLSDVARQVRQGFYGEEVQRIPRGRDNVRVMVRYPLEERRSIENLKDMRIRTRDGHEVPFDSVAEVEFGSGYAYIRREHRERNNYVWAALTEDGMTADEIMEDLRESYFDKWERQFPGLTVGTSGFQQEQEDFMAAFARMGLLTVVAIYALMAIAFRSYTQPLIILTAIPFGFMGAVFGHLIYGATFSIVSYLGFIAAAGVVVNDNLVLVDYVNRLKDEGMEHVEAIRQGAVSRFRPIILTTLTTFIGLLPMMSMTGLQAAFLNNMVISLAFGVLFATSVTLLLVPALMRVGYDFTDGRLWLWDAIKRLARASRRAWSEQPVLPAGE